MTASRVVNRGEGTTESEKYLVRLAERAFLNLWSYPNVFFDKRQKGKGDGKELCDLLIVCGNDVVIFSDKSCGWNHHENEKVAWARWYRSSVSDSAKQIRCAARRIREFPDRLYLDAKCTQRFPIALPNAKTMRVHGLVIARGCAGACLKSMEGYSGSLMIEPDLTDALQAKPETTTPFVIGDLDPSQPFIHVLDEVTLDLVLQELDTITDFTAYLTKKEAFIRSGHLVSAPGEEALLMHYILHMNDRGEHDFTLDHGEPLPAGSELVMADGDYRGSLLRHPSYTAKKQADQISYAWDRLIGTFTKSLLAGENIAPEGQTMALKELEKGIRCMALLPRYIRRGYAKELMEAMQEAKTHARFSRILVPTAREGDTNAETAFIYMALAVPNIELDGGYEQYRQTRRILLHVYALSTLYRHRKIGRVIAIGMEPPPGPYNPKGGGSEDMLYAEQLTEWTPEEIANLRQLEERYEVLDAKRLRERAFSYDEFPEPLARRPSAAARPDGMNRAARRAAKSRARRHK